MHTDISVRLADPTSDKRLNGWIDGVNPIVSVKHNGTDFPKSAVVALMTSKATQEAEFA